MSSPSRELAVAILVVAAVSSAAAQATITINNPEFGTEGIAYSFQLSASGGTAPYTFSCQSPCGLAPATNGLALSNSGLISGTPTTSGTIIFFVQATDANNNTSGYLRKSIVVGVQALTITTTSVLPATRGASYSTPLAAVGGSGTYSWSLKPQSNPLPAGLTVSGSAISGIPSLSNTAGTYTFTVEVEDSQSDVAYQALTLTLNNPAISLSGSLAPGIINGAYSSGASASGGSGGPYTYSWSGNTPPGLNLNTSTGGLIGTPTSTGTFTFTIGVSDGSTYTPAFTPQQYSITIYPAIGISPTNLTAADAGSTYSQTFTAAGGSGSGYSYSISAIPAGMSFSGATLSGPPSSNGSYNFTITAHDSLGFSGISSTITLAVNPALTLSPPAGSLTSGQVGTTYSQTFTAGGGSGNGYTYTFNGTAIPGLTFSAGSLSGSPNKSGPNSFSVTAKDSLGYSISNAYTLSIAPTPLTLSPSSIANGTAGTFYTETFTAAGGLGTYTFSTSGTLPPGLTLNSSGNTATLSGTPTTGGAYSFSVKVTDGTSNTPVTLSMTVSNTAITLNGPSSLPPGIVNGVYPQQTFTATGGTGGPYTFSMSAAVPGLAFSGGVLSGTPTAANGYSFTISVSDGSQYTPAFTPKSYSITVYPAISVTPTSLPAADVNVSYSQSFSASGGSGSGYTFSISSPPPGLGLSSGGLLSGTPTGSGSFGFIITAKDSLGFTGTSASISLAVNPAVTLSPASGALAAGQVGTGYSQGFAASGGSGSYTYSLTGSVPAGLSLTGNVLSGNPTSSGPFSFSVTAKDNLGGTATNSYTLSIANPPIIVQPTTIPSGQVGVPYSQAFTATGGNGGPYTFSITGTAPFGLSFSGATLSGTPTSSGTANVTISATDGTLTGQRIYSLTVTPAGLTLSPSTVANGILGIRYSQSFTAAGGLGTYTFTLTPSAPPGLTFSSSGATATLNGTPTVSGSFPITVSVTDGTSIVPRNYTLAISPSSLAVTASSLPGATLGNPYAATISATGGTPPYSFAVTSGAGLPSGLTLASNGSITGSPASYGTFSFTVTVTDASGVTATANFSIAVQPAPLTITTTALPVAVNGVPYSVTFGATGGVPPYSFSVSTSAPGLSGSGATLAGTPVNLTGSAIMYNVSVQVKDSAGASTGGNFQVTIKPTAALVLSAGSLSFSAVAGGLVPPPQYFSVSSTTTSNLTFSAGSDSPWLSVSPSGNSLSTPATLRVSVNQVTLKASTTAYSGNIDVTGPDGQAQQVSVSLTVLAAPPQLSVAPTIVSFTTDGTSQPGPGSIEVSNAGGGTVNFSVSVVNGSSWVSVGSSPGSVTNTTPVSISVNAVITGLGPGVYRDVIEVDSDSGTADVPVTLLVAGSSTISVEPAGSLFTSRQGQGESDGAQSFQIITTGAGSVSWGATVSGGSGWLTLNTPNGSSSSSQPGVVSYTVNPTQLAPGNYYATIQITAPTASNSPLNFLVVASVAPDSTPAAPDPIPAGLLFISSPGSPVPPAQTVRVNTSSTTSINFSTAANTNTGGAWLMVSPTGGSTSTGTPGLASVTVNAAGLASGVYQGGVSFTLQGNATAVRTVNVVLIVTGSAQSPSMVTHDGPARRLTTNATCAPSQLVAIETGLVSNFSTPAGWPTPLTVQLVDNCANPVSNASVVASFSNGDAPLALPLSNAKNAVYSATWSPHGTSAQVTVTARASAPNLQAATAQIVGAVSANQVPILYPHGTIHNLNPQAGAPLAPGTIVQIYGSGLAASAMQTSLPLPTNVEGTIVLIGGYQAPLYYVSNGQINAQLPLELSAGKQYQILISANGALTLPDTLDIEAVTPGVAASTSGQIVAQHPDGSYVTAASPARPGEIVTIYLAGMGLTDQPITDGEAAPSNPLAHPLVAPTVTVSGEAAQIDFAGLTPQAVGLYQIDFTVPSDAQPGNLTLVVSQGTVNSNSGTLPVQ